MSSDAVEGTGQGMPQEGTDSRSRTHFWRGLLVLGRVSNLPTVWSNCIAAWLVQGQLPSAGLLWVALGGTLLYLGGMYLNDAVDVEFDRRHRQERPIPSGAVPPRLVWVLGILWMVLGWLCFVPFGSTAIVLASCLVVAIVVYDLIHKRFAHSPIVMALCRLFLFLAVAAAADPELDGLTLWFAVVLASYIVGLSYVAKQESLGLSTWVHWWPCALLAGPIVLGWIINAGAYRVPGLVLMAVLIGWIYRCLRATFWTTTPNLGKTVSGLLAGIVLVDLLAILATPWPIGLLLLGFFLLALALQRTIPAT